MTPLQTIAVGFDGSPDAEAAVRWAFELARQVDARVFVVHAVGLLEHATNRKVAAELEKTVRGLTRETGLDPARVRWHRSDGDLCSFEQRLLPLPPTCWWLVRVDRGVHAGLLLGSTSHELVEHAAVPLVIVPMGREGR